MSRWTNSSRLGAADDVDRLFLSVNMDMISANLNHCDSVCNITLRCWLWRRRPLVTAVGLFTHNVSHVWSPIKRWSVTCLLLCHQLFFVVSDISGFLRDFLILYTEICMSNILLNSTFCRLAGTACVCVCMCIYMQICVYIYIMFWQVQVLCCTVN